MDEWAETPVSGVESLFLGCYRGNGGFGRGAVLELNGLMLPGFRHFWYFLVELVLFCARDFG